MFRRQLFAAVASLALILAGSAAIAAPSAQNSPDNTPAPAETSPLNARVAVVHLAPFSSTSTAVTVTFNDAPLGSLSYKQRFPAADGTYVSLPPGSYPVKIFAGSDITATPVISQQVTLAANTDYTIAAIGDKVGDGPGNIPLQLLQLTDDNSDPGSINFKLRVVHAAPFAPQANTGVDVVLQDGTPIPGLQGVPFGASSPYLPLPGGAPLDVKVLAAGTQTVAFDPPALTADAGDIITAFAIGGANGAALELYTVSGSPRATARIRAAHFAPFAAGEASVNILYNDVTTPLISDLTYGEVTDYADVPQGDYELKIDVPDSADAVLATVVYSEAVTLQAGVSYTAVAVGEATAGAPLDILLLEDSPVPPAAGKARIRVVHASPVAAAATVDVRTQAGDLVPTLGGLPYKGVREVTVDPGNYDLKITTVGGATTLIDPPAFTVRAGDVITLFANGSPPNQPLGVAAAVTETGVRLFLPFIPKDQ